MSNWDGKERRRGGDRRRQTDDRRNGERVADEVVPRREPARTGRRRVD